MSARLVTAKLLGSLATLVFVIVFNFFLFRMVETDPVANLFRGRNLSQEQRKELTKEFGLDGSKGHQFVQYMKQTATLNFGRSYTTNQPVADEIRHKAGPTIALVGISSVLSAVIGTLLGITAAWRRRTASDYSIQGFTMAGYAMPDFWLGMILLTTLGVGLGLFQVGGIVGGGPPPRKMGQAAPLSWRTSIGGSWRRDRALSNGSGHRCWWMSIAAMDAEVNRFTRPSCEAVQ